MSAFTQGHAVIIGVGADLPNTIIDAEGLANIIKDPERCAYPADKVRVLTKEKAARNEVLNTLDQLAKEAATDATVIIYFSGHGYELATAIGKQYFLMPYGYNLSDLTSTAISGPEFMAKLEAIKAQKMLILLDCCHAGGMDQEEFNAKAPGIVFTKAPLPPDTVRLLGEGSGRVIIASSQADQKSYTGYPYSQFTQALLEALAGEGASKKDGFARAADLAMYTGRTVPKYTNDKQIPVLNFDKADNFPVAYYAGGDTQPKGLPAEAQRQTAPADVATADQTGSTTIHATNTGSGAQAVGNHNKVAGAGGVVADNITGDVMTGDHAHKINAGTYVEHSTFNQGGQTVHSNQNNFSGNINTGGGMFNTGNINTGGGDFVGRDKRIYGDVVHGDKVGGDKVSGDKINASFGNIGAKAQIAIGREITQTSSGGQSKLAATELNVLRNLLTKLQSQLAQLENLPQHEQILAKDRIEQIEQALKNEGETKEWLILQRASDWLLQHVPALADTLREIFAQPIMMRQAQSAGATAAAWLQNRLSQDI